MYVRQDLFHVADRERVHDFLDSNPFGTIIASTESSAPILTGAPVLLSRDIGEHGELRAHLAVQNPMVRYLLPATVVTVMFVGPNAYVSPSWYESPAEHVPTWNYMTAQAQCSVTRVHDSEELSLLLRDLAHRFEPPNSGWSYERMAPGLRKQLESKIVGFTLKIESLAGRFKVSQNRSRTDQQRVIDRFRSQPDSDCAALADVMSGLLRN